MAARVSTIWFVGDNDVRPKLSGYPQPNQNAALAIARQLHPGNEFESLGPHPLSIAATVQPGYLFIGAYDNICVVCSAELSTYVPSELPDSWLLSPPAHRTFLVSSSPDRARGSFALWENGQLSRSFSALPTDIVENLGIPQTWELPYWAGEHPLRYPPGVLPDPQSLPFHPQQFAEAANAEWLGFRYTGTPHNGDLDKTQILLWGFKIHPGTAIPDALIPDAAPSVVANPEVANPEVVEPEQSAPQAEPEEIPEAPSQLPVAEKPTVAAETVAEPAAVVQESVTVSDTATIAEPTVTIEDSDLLVDDAFADAAEETAEPVTPKKRGFLSRYFGLP